MHSTSALLESLARGDAFRNPYTLAVTILGLLILIIAIRLAMSGAKIRTRAFLSVWFFAAACLASWRVPRPPDHAWALPLAIAISAALALHVLPRFVSATPPKGQR